MNTTTYSWVIPVRNEVESWPKLIKEIKKVMRYKNYEVIVVDDGSTDGSMVKDMAKIQWLRCKEHVGKWEALRLGLKKARGDVIITIDGDLQDNPADVNKLLNKLNQGYDAVGGLRVNRKLISVIGSRILGFADVNTSFKVFRRKLIKFLPPKASQLRFLLWWWKEKGFKIGEIPRISRPRIYGKSHFSWTKYGEIVIDLVRLLIQGWFFQEPDEIWSQRLR
jgi:glycosyltransferase involved in cell wall biosynthesis